MVHDSKQRFVILVTIFHAFVNMRLFPGMVAHIHGWSLQFDNEYIMTVTNTRLLLSDDRYFINFAIYIVTFCIFTAPATNVIKAYLFYFFKAAPVILNFILYGG